MKKCLYILLPLLLLPNMRETNCEESLDMFAHGLKIIVDEASIAQKEDLPQYDLDEAFKELLKEMEEKELSKKIKLEKEEEFKKIEEQKKKFLEEKKEKEMRDLRNNILKNISSQTDEEFKNFTINPDHDNNVLLAKLLEELLWKDENFATEKALAFDLIKTYEKGDSIDFIITKKIDDATKTMTPLLYAIKLQDLDLVKLLLHKGADPLKITQDTSFEKTEVNTPLAQALTIKKGSKEIILSLIATADKNRIDEATSSTDRREVIEYTPLFLAAKNLDTEKLDTEVLVLLLKKEANPLKEVKQGIGKSTPLYKMLEKLESLEDIKSRNVLIDIITPTLEKQKPDTIIYSSSISGDQTIEKMIDEIKDDTIKKTLKNALKKE